MKSNFFMGMAVLLSFWLVLAGCGDNPGTSPATNLLSGTFNGLKFVANKNNTTVRSVRAALADTPSEGLTGYLQDGDKRYELKGFYNSASGNFILTGASAGVVFTINGANDLDGKRTGRGYNAKKTGSSWDEGNSDFIVFDSEVSVEQSSTVQSVTGLPEKWWGKWDNSGAINAQTVEGFGTSHSEETGMYCLVVSSFGLATWLDTDMDFENQMAIQREYYSEDKTEAQMQTDAIKQVGQNIISCVRDFNVCEVEKISDDEYHVLASLIMTRLREEENGDRFTVFEDPKYMKIRFKTHGTGLTATIASVEEDGWPKTKFETIEEARAANTFADDNETLYAGDNVMDNTTVLFLKRF